MNRVPKTSTALAMALAAATVAAPASAETLSHATIGPLTIQLFDLDTLDGVTPWLHFNASPDGFGNALQASAQQSKPEFDEVRRGSDPAQWTPAAFDATAGVARAQASIGGVGQAAAATLRASGSAGNFSAGYWDSAQYGAHAQVSQFGYLGAGFVLSANTLVIVSGWAEVAAAGQSGNPARRSGDIATARVQMLMNGPGAKGAGVQLSSANLAVFGRSVLGSAFDLADHADLGVSFTNLTSGDMTGDFQLGVTVFGTTHAQSVPEPESLALMLAGLLAVGQAARRRRG